MYNNLVLSSLTYLFLRTVVLNIIFLLLLLGSDFAQTAEISGYLKDEADQPVEGVSVGVQEDVKYAANSDANGFYRLVLPAGTEYSLTFYSINYDKQVLKIKLKPDENRVLSLKMRFKNALSEVSVDGGNER